MKKFLALLLAAMMALSCTAFAAAEEVDADLLAAAKAEGELIVYGSAEEAYVSAACKHFEELYGIKVSYQRLSTGEVQAKITEENGNPSADVWFGGTSDPYAEAASAGLLLPYEAKNASHLVNQNYRDKDGGRWDYNVMSLTFENGKHITIDRWVNPFFDIWMQHIMSRPSCYECRYTTSRRCSDITLGDLWGVHIFCPELYNDNHGSSVMIPSTEKGRTAIELAKQQMTTRELDMDTVVKYANRMRDPIAMNERREEFLSDLDKMEFKRIKRKWMRRPPLKLLIKKYIYGTNRQVVRKYLKKQAHRKGQK